MRGGVVAASLLVACSSSELFVPVPPGALASLYVSFDSQGAVVDALAFGATSTTRLIDTEPSSAAVIHYERTLADLGFAVEGGLLLRSSDPLASRAVPLPIAWTEIADRALTPQVVTETSFRSRFSGLRVPTPPCRALSFPRSPTSIAGIIGMSLPIGREHVVASVEGSGFIAEVHVFSDTTDAVVATSTGGAVGFRLPDGRVWFVIHRADGPAPSELCAMTPDAPLVVRCEPVVVEGAPAGEFFPSIMAGQLIGGRYEAYAMNFNGRLWLGREGEPWREIATRIPRPGHECSVGTQTLVLELDGPRTGLAGFPAGELVRFSVGDTGPAVLEPLFAQGEAPPRLCRNVYGRYADGTELVGLIESNDEISVVPLPRFFWRPRSGDRWAELPGVAGADTRMLVAHGGVFLLGAETQDIRVVDVDGHGNAPRFCLPQPVGGVPRTITSLDDGRVFVGATDPNAMRSLIGWSQLED